MLPRFCVFLLSMLVLGGLTPAADREGCLDLSGKWGFQLDPQDAGIKESWMARPLSGSIKLPGTTTSAGLGTALALQPTLTKESFQHLHQRFKYTGPAWYVKTIVVPKDWQGRQVQLFLERVIWETRVWCNGQEAGMQDSLTTPHVHDLTAFLKPGENTIAIRVDNRCKLDIGIGHAYTDETQTIWNGVIGRIELQAFAPVHIDRLWVNPQPEQATATVRITLTNGTGKPAAGKITVRAIPVNHDGPKPPPATCAYEVGGKEGMVELAYPMGKEFRPWSEFTPDLYRLEASLEDGLIVSAPLGMRTIRAEGTQFTVNGRKTFLRGTLECCIFPKTGYPAMDEAGWEKIFRTAQEYGLNHLRFHSWCPPEAAFAVADRHGFCLQVELPNWSFAMGKKPAVDAWFGLEGERMLRQYANHPSFAFLSLGNELGGDLESMDKLIEHLRSVDPRPKYTSTSFAFSPRGGLPGRADDYFISQQTKSGWVRGQGFLNQTRPNTVSDYADGLKCLKIPLLTHEVGQYNVFPNLAELPKYDGCLRALGYEAIRDDLAKKGRLHEAADYTLNSGKLAALLYKEDLERAFRTRGQAGIQLLDLHDFPGQSTATVGLLDSFWDSKGILAAREFRRFCAPVVPLLRMPKMTWSSAETFTAAMEIANFGPGDLKDHAVYWKIEDAKGHLIGQATLPPAAIPNGNGNAVGTISQPLGKVTEAAALKVTVGIAGTPYENDWTIWVYPPVPAVVGEVAVARKFDQALLDQLKQGKSVLFLPEASAIRQPLPGRFIPVFWSPLHFPNQPASLGTLIDDRHPLWREFPTASHTDWQWWELLSTSTSVNADALGPKFTPVMRFIDKFNRNSLPAIIWEARVGQGRLLVCTLDIESKPEERLAAAQLRRAILDYMNSPAFKPKQELTANDLAQLFQMKAFTARQITGTANPQYPVGNLADSNPATFWHSDWENAANRFPYTIELRLETAATLAGLDYLPRQDMDRGRIAACRIQTSLDGQAWTPAATATFKGDAKLQKIRFPAPVKATFIRFIAESEIKGNDFAAIAELTPVAGAAKNGDVRELGIVEGFNDK